MRKQSLLTLACAAAVLVPAIAQTVLKMPERKTASGNEVALTSQKRTAARTHAQRGAVNIADGIPAADALMRAEYEAQYGSIPERNVMRTPFGPEDDTQYTYTGFNVAAGLDANGAQTGGMVNFNLSPFACDTISSDSGVSPYSYVNGNDLYCLLPQMDASGKYNGITRTVYDANTLERKSQDALTMSHAGDMSYVPYLLSYDDQRGVTYAITMSNYSTAAGESGTYYYLNIWNPEEGKIQRLGYLGKWSNYQNDEDQMNIKGFCCGYGTLYIQYVTDKVTFAKVNPVNCEVTPLGKTDITAQYIYGQQPMIYDPNSGQLLVNHYDFTNGTQYYKVSTWATDGMLKAELVENAPTGFIFFYKRPETNFQSFSNMMEAVTDLEITPSEDLKSVSFSFTVPSKLADGSEIDFPSWVQDYQKTVRVNLTADNSYLTLEGINGNQPYGTKVTGTAKLEESWYNIEPGLHTFTLKLTSMYNEVGIPLATITMMVGPDAPAAPTNASLAINGTDAAIKWTAPKEAWHADFGTTIDPSKITYRVVRDNDGKTVAEDLTSTSCTDNIESEIFQLYTYSIYPVIDGVSGPAAKTNAVTGGQYLALPWSENFASGTCLDGWSIYYFDINNGSYNTWRWNNIYHFLTAGWGEGDDWAITPPMRLEAGKVYEFRIDQTGAGELQLFYGQGNTRDDMTNNIGVIYDTPKQESSFYYITPAETGNYNFGLWNHSLPVDDNFRNVYFTGVTEVAGPKSPAAPTELSFAGDGAQPEGTVTATMPTTTVDGSALSSLSEMKVLAADGTVLGTAPATPGEKVSVKVTLPEGTNTVRVLASDAQGDGCPAPLRLFAGEDIPGAVKNLTARWGDATNKFVLTWDAPESANGGYINTESLEYILYKLNEETYQREEIGRTTDRNVEVEILDNSAQDQYALSVSASNTKGEGEYSQVGIVLGAPYDLPFDEPFASDGIDHSPWLLMPVTSGQNWQLDGGYFNPEIQPQNEDGLQLVFVNYSTAEGAARFVSPIVDLTNAKAPVFSVWVNHAPGMNASSTLSIDASTDGSKVFTPVADPVALNGGNGWQQHFFPMASLIGKKVQFGVTGTIADTKDRIFIDNFSLYDAEGEDIALTGITTTDYCKAGQTVPVEVTVANAGGTEISDYTVMFSVNGNIVEEKAGPKLAPGEEARVKFDLTLNAADNGNTTYSAEVMSDNDTNEANNISPEVKVTLLDTNLPAPRNFESTADAQLTWEAPEIGEGRPVTLTFEDVPAFQTDNIEGWNTYDGDKHLTLTFQQYYDNYWPNAYQPMAFMTWSPLEAGCETAEIWQPYKGEKCLISWGNYGADAEGRDNTSEPEDDWFISPELLGGSEISFMTLSNDQASVDVLYSTTGRNPEDFTGKLTSVDYSSASVWSEVKATLPEDAKYVAIHITKNGFGILFDNLTYTEAATPVLQGYNVYAFGPEAETFTQDCEYRSERKIQHAVSALYDLGESAITDWRGPSKVSDIFAGAESLNVRAGKGFITVSDAEGRILTVSNLAGIKFHEAPANGEVTVTLPAGIYVVKAGDKTAKVVVK